jgi:hypothetical protein
MTVTFEEFSPTHDFFDRKPVIPPVAAEKNECKKLGGFPAMRVMILQLLQAKIS